jgi:exo-beta-1,3-glucanase (GH17 family)
MDGQDPTIDDRISEKQIIARMKIIAPYTEWIRTFSCVNGMDQVGRLAHQMGLKAAIGAWLDVDTKANDKQITSLIQIAKAGEADVLILGNEVLLHRTISEAQLIKYLQYVKQEVPNLPVTTVDIYNEIMRHPKVAEACDIIMINCHPFWEKRDIRQALPRLQLVYEQVKSRYKDKQVILSEVGWPSGGGNMGPAIASLENSQLFFDAFIAWASQNNVPYFYFEAFDESWKAGYEPVAGAHWGIWDKKGKLKLNRRSLMIK